MAKLSAHGLEIGRINYVSKSVAYFEDGVVLVNYGDGWKKRGKLKDGVIPAQAFEEKQIKHNEFLAGRPALAQYRRELHALAGLSKRGKLHMAVSLMPNDCDGVWSEVCDGYSDNVHADVDEVGKLCTLYLAAMRETKSMKPVTA